MCSDCAGYPFPVVVFEFVLPAMRPDSWSQIDKLDTPGTPPNLEHGLKPNLSQWAWDSCNGLTSDTLSPCLLFLTLWIVDVGVAILRGTSRVEMLDYSHRFAWRKASCQMQNGPLLVCLGPPVAVFFIFFSITCVYVNEVAPHSWESTDRERGDKGIRIV